MDQIREHQYGSDDRCMHCGDKRSDNTAGGGGERSCVARPKPRDPFVSVFENPSEIGDRMREIQAQELKALQGAAPIPEAPDLCGLRPLLQTLQDEVVRKLRAGVPVPALEIQRAYVRGYID